MANLLKRNDDGTLRIICNNRNSDGGCYGCTKVWECNRKLYARLAEFEEIGIEPENLKSLSESYTHTVTETCPHCEHQLEMTWDVQTMGFKVFCPECGNSIMLCDACIHAEDRLNENSSSCDWHEGSNGEPLCFRVQE